jgi:hypothetical protein
MSKMKPVHPGEILLEGFLNPMEITPYRLAKDIICARAAHQRDCTWQTSGFRQHRPAAGKIFRDVRRAAASLLLEIPKALSEYLRSGSTSNLAIGGVIFCDLGTTIRHFLVFRVEDPDASGHVLFRNHLLINN